jgi:hypothetical protein
MLRSAFEPLSVANDFAFSDWPGAKIKIFQIRGLWKPLIAIEASYQTEKRMHAGELILAGIGGQHAQKKQAS